MKTLREYIADAEQRRVAIGHFNISNIEGLWGVFRAAKKLNVPVIIGASEGERDFIGVHQVAALVRSLREEFEYPVFLNADHTYSFERVQEAIDAGFDAVIFDGAQLSFEENVAVTKHCVEYAKSVNQHIIIEAELGYIGTSSKLLDAIPDGVGMSGDALTSPEHAQEFVKLTGIDLLAPSVGNFHGILKQNHKVIGAPERIKKLDAARIKEIREAAGIPLVLHGGSGTLDPDFVDAIKAGISIVHINTEIRLAYKKALELSLQENPDEVAPYKILKGPVQAIQKVVEDRLRLFNS